MLITPELARIFHHRWTVPLIAELARRDGERFITLSHRLAVSPPVLRQTIDSACAAGWVMANSGYGHPLRPEYVLTDAGRRISDPCLKLDQMLDGAAAREIGLRKWSFPLLLAAERDPARFAQLRDRLPKVTDRALSRAVADLRRIRWLSRRIEANPRPIAWYETTRIAQPYLNVSRTLAHSLVG